MQNTYNDYFNNIAANNNILDIQDDVDDINDLIHVHANIQPTMKGSVQNVYN